MNRKINYTICQLHQQPLNMICLRPNCENDRIICALCKAQRHKQPHYVMPIKIYLKKKIDKFNCLTIGQIGHITKSLADQRQKLCSYIKNIQTKFSDEMEIIRTQVEHFYDTKIEIFEKSEQYLNNCSPNLNDLDFIQATLGIANNYEQYQYLGLQKLKQIQKTIIQSYKSFYFDISTQNPHSWVGHDKIRYDHNLLISKSEGYKVAYFTKPLSLRNQQMNYTMIKSENNWIGIGICHKEIVQKNNFLFKYHTIGHGIYAISSNGGSWSHNKRQFNNKLSAFRFSINQTIKISYDASILKIIFVHQNGAKYSLDLDPQQQGNLHFCLLFYYKGDICEINQLL